MLSKAYPNLFETTTKAAISFISTAIFLWAGEYFFYKKENGKLKKYLKNKIELLIFFIGIVLISAGYIKNNASLLEFGYYSAFFGPYIGLSHKGINSFSQQQWQESTNRE